MKQFFLLAFLALLLLSPALHAETEKTMVLVSDNDADLAVASALATQFQYDLVIIEWGEYDRGILTRVISESPDHVFIIGREKAVPKTYTKKIKAARISTEVLGGRTRQQTSIITYLRFRDSHIPAIVSDGGNPILTDVAIPIFVWDDIEEVKELVRLLGPSVNIVNYGRATEVLQGTNRAGLAASSGAEQSSQDLIAALQSEAAANTVISSETTTAVVRESGAEVRAGLVEEVAPPSSDVTTDPGSSSTTTPVTATATVTYPNGGEVENDTMAITWTATAAYSNVVLYYKTDPAATAGTLMTTTSNTGSYVWNTTAVPNGISYIICISLTGARLDDCSDASFIIENGASGAAPVVTPNQPPVVTFTLSPSTGIAPVSVNFVSVATDPDGTILGYAWDFADGETSIVQNPTHLFTTAGIHTIRLSVTDNRSTTAFAEKNITVVANQLPTANAYSSISSGAAPLIVQFTANASDSDGTITSYAWVFGDGTTSIEANPVHSYAANGNYTATLTVTDDKGGSVSKSLDTSVYSGLLLENITTYPSWGDYRTSGTLVTFTFEAEPNTALNISYYYSYIANSNGKVAYVRTYLNGQQINSLGFTTPKNSYSTAPKKVSTTATTQTNTLRFDFTNGDWRMGIKNITVFGTPPGTGPTGGITLGMAPRLTAWLQAWLS